MQRSYSSSSVHHRSHHSDRTVPIRVIPKIHHDYYSSDTDSYHATNLQRTSSTSSFCSSNSTGSANYRILPVRYSSVDRVLSKPAVVTANEHGINVRIRFERPHCHKFHRRHHQHQHEHHTDEYERHYEKHTSKEEERRRQQQEHYGSCPVLNGNVSSSMFNRAHPSNINYIATRSIVRGYSTEQLNRNNHSSTLVIRQQSLPPLTSSPKFRLASTRITHIPLDTYQTLIPTIIREEKEEE
jgi:hypothetical protein